MDKYIKNSNLLDNLYTNFKSISNHSQLLPYIKKSPFSIIYGPTMSGKTYALSLIFKKAKGSIIYIRSSPVRFECDNAKVFNKKTNQATIDQVEKIMKSRSKKIRSGTGDLKGQSPLSWITVIFDDIQNLDKELSNKYKTLISTLAFSGRHYKIRTIILLQSYMKLDKSIRSQATSFMCILPVTDSYRSQIYQDYFRIFKSEQDLVYLEKLPPYSFLFKFNNRDRFYFLKE